MKRALTIAGLAVGAVLVLGVSCIMTIAVVDVIRYAPDVVPGAGRSAPADPSDPVQRGEAIYRQRCAGCHTIDGSRRVGPTLRGLYGSEVPLEDGSTVVADEAYIRESIVDPTARIHAGYPRAMPSFDDLSDQEIDDLIAFIRSPE
ncbi:MAG: cytochrome c [Sphaerobacter sp.]|nr:cytochrome c [Sphaerobacter sp.]